MTKKKALANAIELLERHAGICEHNAAINNDEGNYAQEKLNRELAESYRAGVSSLKSSK
ncbi:hypothetical protein CNR34_00161 [Pseudomonas phage nickie]|uniref:Uncharacterized protein n=1 Tax=Pseudomonas phage nickie TaxID=2048977 RepID=A0A2H4P7C1_9CAUD|nr:hypothetical protein FDJ16_gp005 [Pseudomonas phage nickie]ATW58093.1 hypothetical protein CNR34_00161 [Pseudomonas phage nickie]